MNDTFHAKTRAAWRDWLEARHRDSEEIWLVFYRKQLGKPGVEYADAVEEALCFGWVDGLKRRIDDERYAYRFTPRKPGSKWSPLNVERAGRMIEQGLMAKAGLEAFRRRKTYEPEFLEARASKDISLPAEMEKAIRADPVAWANFAALAPGYRKQYAGWLANAVKRETKERRLKEAIRLLRENRKLGMK